MNINILRYPLFGIAGGQELDRNFSKNLLLQKLAGWVATCMTYNTHAWYF